MATSTLNPLANTFVPSNPKSSEMVSLGKISTKSMAAKLLQDLVESKKNSNKSITKEEIITIVEKLISLRYKASPASETMSLNAYIASKVPKVLSLKPLIPAKQSEDDQKVPIKTFDLSTFRVPKLSMLLVSMWGLYRQEQALRPMLSLTLRPDTLEDKIWSITSKDLKVWNNCAVESPCSCPPMFGYAIPSSFFGNILTKEYNCPVQSIHLNRYPETEAGNEFVSMVGDRSIVLWPKVFTDLEDDVTSEKDLEYYAEQLKTIVSAVCDMVADEDEGIDTTEFDSTEDDACDFTELLWDSDSKSNKPMGDEIAEDDNCHPLLEVVPAVEDLTCEGVTREVKELIRRSLSTDSEAELVTSEESSEQVNACDPPCSVWCHSSPKSTGSSSEVISMLNDTTDFLLNPNGCISGKPLSSNAFEAGLNHSQRPYFKRSFSANDCDSYYATYKMPSISKVSASSREALAFLRRDPINFFKSIKDRNDSWKDSDSGIVSQSSSNEDVFNGSEGSEEQLADHDITPMWSFFSGEGSLWKPLPQQDEASKLSHKRVRELRRQKSIN